VTHEQAVERIAVRLGEVWPARFGADPRSVLGWHSAAEMLWRAGWRGDTSPEQARDLLRRHAIRTWTPSLSKIALRLDPLLLVGCDVDGPRCTGRRAYWRLIECGRTCCSPCLAIVEIGR